MSYELVMAVNGKIDETFESKRLKYYEEYAVLNFTKPK